MWPIASAIYWCHGALIDELDAHCLANAHSVLQQVLDNALHVCDISSARSECELIETKQPETTYPKEPEDLRFLSYNLAVHFTLN